VQKQHQRHFFENPDAEQSDDMIAETDYAAALREVTRNSVNTNRRASGSPQASPHSPGVS
jgi:hypothetical protein